LGDGESQTCSSQVPAACLIDAIETLEDFALFFGCDSDSSVSNRDHDFVIVLFEREVHGPGRRSVLESIVQQDVDGSSQRRFVSQDQRFPSLDAVANCRSLILATRRQPSTTSRKISRTSTGCRLRVSRPASARARARSSSINEVVLSASSRMCRNASLYSDSPRDLLRANSASVRTSEMGVRSSWEASAVNCVTRRKAKLNTVQHFIQCVRQALQFIPSV